MNRLIKNGDNLSLKVDYRKEQILPPKQFDETTENSVNKRIISSFKDNRDGRVYRTVQIGAQTWMAENLAYKPKSGNYWAYDDNPVNIKTYGYLYDWKTACEVCPAGWRLPTEDDWKLLLINLKKDHIKSDFSALPGGYYGLSGQFLLIGDTGAWWSSSQPYSKRGTAFLLNYKSNEWGLGTYPISNGFSVRCIKN